MNGWRSVADDPLPRDSWVLVWHRGSLTLAKYTPQFPVPGVHDWLLLPPGRNPFAPFPTYHPRWWRPNLDPPSDMDHDLGPDEQVGETLIRWRGSVGDLATDLKEAVPLDELERLCVELLAPPYSQPTIPAAPPNSIVWRDTMTEFVKDVEVFLGSESRWREFLEALPSPPTKRRMTLPERRTLVSKLVDERPSIEELVKELKVALGEGDGWHAFQWVVRNEHPHPPVPMLLYCPECNERHVDEGQFATQPHHTHECQFCGATWRAAVVPTVGVRFLFRKSPDPAASTRTPATVSGRNPGETEWRWPRAPAKKCDRCDRFCSKVEDHGDDCPEKDVLR